MGAGGNRTCIDFAGNTIGGGSGTVQLREDPASGAAAASILDIEQSSSATLASGNGIPAANISTTVSSGAPSFGVSCLAPPAP